MQTKRVLAVALAVVCAGCLAWVGASLVGGSRAVAQGSASQRWEYLIVSPGQADWCAESATGRTDACPSGSIKSYSMFHLASPGNSAAYNHPVEATNLEAYLDTIGLSGWELVAVIGLIGGDQEFVFKRPLP
jgi:hypothetical protein